MSFLEDLFPTRSGSNIGSAEERKMLSAAGGAFGIRTQIRTNLDGSVTTLRTRGGMPHFDTVSAPSLPVSKQVVYSELYFRLVGTTHPYGVSLTENAGSYTPSAPWAWPGFPVSHASSKDFGSAQVPTATFEASDGPGTFTWYDDRDAGDFDVTLSWNCVVGGPGMTHEAGYYQGLFPIRRTSLSISLYDTTYPTESSANQTPVPVLSSGVMAVSAGRILPGQGYGKFGYQLSTLPGNTFTTGIGSRRFVQSNAAGYLYEDGVKLPISGLLMAACKHKKSDGTIVYRTIESASVTQSFAWNAYFLREYSAAGVQLKSTLVSTGLTTVHITQAPRFNASGTQAAAVHVVSSAGVHSQKVVLINAETGAVSFATERGVWSRTGSDDYGSVSVTEYPLIHGAGYAGDDLTVIWSQTSVQVTNATLNEQTLPNPDPFALPDGAYPCNAATSWSATKAQTIYANALVLKTLTGTARGAYENDFTVVKAAGAVTSSGSGSRQQSYSGDWYGIGNVLVDITGGVVVFARVPQLSPMASTDAWTIHEGANNAHPAVWSYKNSYGYTSTYHSSVAECRIELIDLKAGTEKTLANEVVETVVEHSSAPIDFSTLHLPAPASFYGEMSASTTKQLVLSSAVSYLDALSFAVSKDRAHRVVSGLFSKQVSSGSDAWLPGPGVTGASFTFKPFTKYMDVSTGDVADLGLPDFGDSMAWILEPMFLQKKAQTP